MLADFFDFELQQILAGPAQHPRRPFARLLECMPDCCCGSICPAYLRHRRLNSSTAVALRGASAAPVARLVPHRAGTCANGSAGVGIAVARRIPHRSPAGRNYGRKKSSVITLAVSGTASSGAMGGRFRTRSR
jgi:antitoxin (DNA-binding transcriptional repressor) of toxin-antitoxin stability system